MALARANVCPRGKMNGVTCGLRHPKAFHTGSMLGMGGGDGLRVLPGFVEQKEGHVGSGEGPLQQVEEGISERKQTGAVRLDPWVPGKGPLGTVPLRAGGLGTIAMWRQDQNGCIKASEVEGVRHWYPGPRSEGKSGWPSRHCRESRCSLNLWEIQSGSILSKMLLRLPPSAQRASLHRALSLLSVLFPQRSLQGSDPSDGGESPWCHTQELVGTGHHQLPFYLESQSSRR